MNKKLKKFLKIFIFLIIGLFVSVPLSISLVFFATLLHPILGLCVVLIFIAAIAAFVLVRIDE